MMLKRNLFAAALMAVALSSVTIAQTPAGSAFTYQGRLMDNGQPASGAYDFLIQFYDAPTGGSLVGPPFITQNDIPVTNGLFTMTLDIGASAFAGDARWVNLSVRPGASGGSYTPLAPRQSLTPVPYAIYALNDARWQASGSAISNTNSGFVGINRSTPHTPAECFGIQSPATGTSYGGMYIRTDSPAANPFYGYATGAGNAWTYVNGTNGSWHVNNGGDHFTVENSGNVGIGATNPASRLHVSAGNATAVRAASAFTSPGTPATDATMAVVGGTDSEPTGGGFIVAGSVTATNISIDNNEIMARNNGAESTLYLNADGGAVGIGTAAVPAGAALAVDGKVLCEELEVQLSQDWPDYVFEDDYALMSLDQVDAFIKSHGHLPGVPSAAAVKSEGVSVGAMQATLLEKVEELTLHMIELDRQLAEVRSENKALRARLGSAPGLNR